MGLGVNFYAAKTFPAKSQRKPKGAEGGAMNAHHIPIGFFLRESLS